jgi:anti-anti-sigma factor
LIRKPLSTRLEDGRSLIQTYPWRTRRCAKSDIEEGGQLADATSGGLLDSSSHFALAEGGVASFYGQAKGRHMTVDLFGVTSYEFGGGRVFALRGELDACTCRGLAELLIGPPGSLVVIDLDQLTYIDSSGLGAIHAARRVAIKGGGTLIVCRPSPMVHRVLEITGLDTWIADWDPIWSNGSAVGCAP